MTATFFLYALSAIRDAFLAVSTLFPYAPWVLCLWGAGGLAMDWMATDRGAHL